MTTSDVLKTQGPAGEGGAPGRSTDWVALARELGPSLAERAAAHDAQDAFVAESFAELKERRFFSAGVPAELGGGGASHGELCAMLRELGRYCGSTALALSMHTHLLAATVWRWRQGQPAEPLLRRVASEELVLVSTGASDWLLSSGSAERVDGGYRVSGRKVFASGSPAGNLLVTSAVYHDPGAGDVVLHFGVPMQAPGVQVLDNWRAMSMRGTGSNDVLLEGVFVPDAAITMRRPRGPWHPLFTVIAAVALPLIMSAYLGVAEAAAALARDAARKKRDDPQVVSLVGEMENALTTAQLAVESMVALCDNYAFAVTPETASAALVRKTIAAQATLATAEKALQVVGGSGLFRSLGLERLVRDAHGAQFHPLPEKRQVLLTGRVTLGLDPVEWPLPA